MNPGQLTQGDYQFMTNENLLTCNVIVTVQFCGSEFKSKLSNSEARLNKLPANLFWIVLNLCNVVCRSRVVVNTIFYEPLFINKMTKDLQSNLAHHPSGCHLSNLQEMTDEGTLLNSGRLVLDD